MKNWRTDRIYTWTFIGVTIGAFLIWMITLLAGGPESEQFGLFFRNCQDFLADTLNVVGYSSQQDPYHNLMYTGLQEKAYPPLTYVLMYLLSKVANMGYYWSRNYFLDMFHEPKFLIIYLIFAVAVMIMAYQLLCTVKKGGKRVKVWTAVAILVSAPMIYSFERANTIIFTMICVMYFVFYFDSKNKIKHELALIALAVAVALKMTPAVLGIFLLYYKQWKDIGKLAIYALIIGIGPFFFLEGGLSNLAQMFENMQSNLDSYSSLDGCTLLACVKDFVTVEQVSETFYTVVDVITMIISLFFLIAAVFYKKRWEMIMAVTLVLLILPSHSGYYCILYMIPAMVAFLNEKEHKKSDVLILIAMLCIMLDIQIPTLPEDIGCHVGILMMIAVLMARGILQMCQKEGRAILVDKK